MASRSRRPVGAATGISGRPGSTTAGTNAHRGGIEWISLPLLLGLLAVSAACSGASVAGDDTGLEPIVGDWRGVLLSQGGELPFGFRVNPEGSDPAAALINGGAEQPVVCVTRQGAASYTLRLFDTTDAEIVAKLSPDGQHLSGYWRYAYEGSGDGDGNDGVVKRTTQMPFAATKNDRRRFQRNDPAVAVASPEGVAALPQLDGAWEFRVVAGGSTTTESGELVQRDEHVVAHVISRGMEGIYRNGLLRLSMFDGLRPLLLHARAKPDRTLEGTLWTADQPPARVTATRVDPAR